MRLGDRTRNKKPSADQAIGWGSPIALSQLAFLRLNDGLHPPDQTLRGGFTGQIIELHGEWSHKALADTDAHQGISLKLADVEVVCDRRLWKNVYSLLRFSDRGGERRNQRKQ